MQNRPNRIHFPEVNSNTLWLSGDQSQEIQTPGKLQRGVFPFAGNDISAEILVSPIQESTRFMHPNTADKYFEWREEAGLLTPAKTPSDILRRGPVFLDETDVDETSQVDSDFLKEQVRFHRARQDVIERSLAKLQEVLDWHKDQASRYTTLLQR